jgi:23S rRNA pseudouridine1911/1915/1917 synthase
VNGAALPILYEDNHCLVIDKPAGVLSQPDAGGTPSVVDLAREDLKRRYEKPGNVYVGLVHRLDRPVSGALLIAKTSKAAARLAEAFRTGNVRKTYWALVEGEVRNAPEVLSDWLVKDAISNRVRTASHAAAGSKPAELALRVLARDGGRTLLELKPVSGRSHQIRVQLASRGWPIVGDLKYGSKTPLRASDGGNRIALHARRLEFTHPTRKQSIGVDAPVPADLPELARLATRLIDP